MQHETHYNVFFGFRALSLPKRDSIVKLEKFYQTYMDRTLINSSMGLIRIHKIVYIFT